MSFDLNSWLKATINIKSFDASADGKRRVLIFQEVRPRFVCQDGYSISIQANENAYCQPRITQYQEGNIWHVINGDCVGYGKRPRNYDSENYIPYESVELGYPSEEDELINEYAEDEDYLETVYGYVPIEVVEKLIEKHGGYKGIDKRDAEKE